MSMNTDNLKEKIKKHPLLKRVVLNFLMHPIKTRPQWWIRIFMPFYIKRGKGSVIYRSVRKDIVPFNVFELGKRSVIEDYSVINNAVGNLVIGNNTRVGIGNTIIGPVTISDNVNIGQNVTISGLNHNYEDPGKTISEQGVSTMPIKIENNVWIGANSVVLPGVQIGNHSVIGAGSIITKDIPPYSVAVGNPARIVKRYDMDLKEWVKI